MTELTATSPLRLGPLAVYSRQIASRLSHMHFVLVALVVLFGGLYLYSPDQAFRTIRNVAGELAHIGPWLAASVMVAAAAKAPGPIRSRRGRFADGKAAWSSSRRWSAHFCPSAPAASSRSSQVCSARGFRWPL